jgi:hypothetical protein
MDISIHFDKGRSTWDSDKAQTGHTHSEKARTGHTHSDKAWMNHPKDSDKVGLITLGF